MLRRKELCPGAEVCPYAQTEAPGEGLPCEGCPEQLLLKHMKTPLGALIGIALDFDCAMQVGLSVTMSQIPFPVFLLLRQLGEERLRYNDEQQRKNRH